MKSPLLLPLLILCVCCNLCFIPGNIFRISGVLKGAPDSTLLYLYKGIRKTDSAYVLNGKFYFSGQVAAPAEQLIIRTSDFSEAKYMWVENKEISVEGEKGKLREAVVRGSAAQLENEQLDILRNRLYAIRDSIKKTHSADTSGVSKLALKKAQDDIEKQLRQTDRDFIRQHPSSIVSAVLVSTYASSWGRDTTAALYKLLNASIQQTRYGKDAAAFIRLNKPVDIGMPAPLFTAPGINNENISLASYKGKVVLIEFWASWCGPCRKSNPELVKLYEEFHPKGLEILGISLDEDRVDWETAIKQDKLPWPQAADLKGPKTAPALIYGVSAIPDNFLIDVNGNIIAHRLNTKALREKLSERLQ